MAERRMIFDVGPVEPCGCRWQVWAEDGDIHVGAACDRCHQEIKRILLERWPGLPFTYGD